MSGTHYPKSNNRGSCGCMRTTLVCTFNSRTLLFSTKPLHRRRHGRRRGHGHTPMHTQPHAWAVLYTIPWGPSWGPVRLGGPKQYCVVVWLLTTVREPVMPVTRPSNGAKCSSVSDLPVTCLKAAKAWTSIAILSTQVAESEISFNRDDRALFCIPCGTL